MLEKIQAMLAEALNLPIEKVTPDSKSLMILALIPWTL